MDTCPAMFMGVGLACQEILRGDGLKVLKNISVKQLKRREIDREQPGRILFWA